MTDLAELFARDPLTLNREDFSAIVAELRSRRAQFTLGAQKAGSMKPKTEKQKATAALTESLGIKIDLSSILGKKL